MASKRSILLGALLVTTALAGCFGDDAPPAAYTVEASGGSAADSWDYDGSTLTDAGATLEGQLDHEADTGVLNVTFEAWGSTWTVTHDSFAGAEDFKQGGIALDVVEHGDSGVGSTVIPISRGELMTWGNAEVFRDGDPYTVARGPGGTWSAHLMLLEDAIRGPDGQITTADGSAPFDPSTPGDARVLEDDPQAMLELTAPSGADSARAPAPVNGSIEIQTPTTTEGSLEIPTAAYSTATLTVNTTPSQGVMGQGLQGGQIDVRIVDEEGTAIAEDSAEFTPNEPYSGTFEVTDVAAPTTLIVSGNGTYTAEVTGQVVYDDHPHITLTWDDYALEPR